MIQNCFICKKQINVPNWKVRSYHKRAANKHFFCSRDCFIIYWKSSRVCVRGNGIDGICEWCKEKFHRRKKSDRVDRFCSKDCFYLWIRSFWKGKPKYKRKYIPERHNREYVRWRKSVIERDGRCDICKIKTDLEAHHIKSFKDSQELRYDTNNGITLCRKCHFENSDYNPVTTSH